MINFQVSLDIFDDKDQGEGQVKVTTGKELRERETKAKLKEVSHGASQDRRAIDYDPSKSKTVTTVKLSFFANNVKPSPPLSIEEQNYINRRVAERRAAQGIPKRTHLTPEQRVKVDDLKIILLEAMRSHLNHDTFNLEELCKLD